MIVLDRDRRWMPAIWQFCPSYRGDPLIYRPIGLTIGSRYPTTCAYWSTQFKDVLAIPVSTWRNRLQRLFETPPVAAPAFLLVDETTPLVGHDNGWLRKTSVVEPTYLGIFPSSGKPSSVFRDPNIHVHILELHMNEIIVVYVHKTNVCERSRSRTTPNNESM